MWNKITNFLKKIFGSKKVEVDVSNKNKSDNVVGNNSIQDLSKTKNVFKGNKNIAFNQDAASLIVNEIKNLVKQKTEKIMIIQNCEKCNELTEREILLLEKQLHDIKEKELNEIYSSSPVIIRYDTTKIQLKLENLKNESLYLVCEKHKKISNEVFNINEAINTYNNFLNNKK